MNQRLSLYAVTDGARTNEAQLHAALAGGVTCVQLREKNLPFDLLVAKAVSFRKICAQYGVPMIVNDSVDVALASGADGVHLGQSDGSAAEARRILGPDAILGVSVQTLDEAFLAQKDGADYLGVGAIFPTATKLDAQKVAIATLRSICEKVQIPVVAIGGIGPKEIETLAGTGIAGVAVVSAIFSQPDITAATAELLERLRQCEIHSSR